MPPTTISRLPSCCGAVLSLLTWATAGESPALAGTVVFGTGYDDHAVLLPEIFSIDSDSSGASADARAQLDWRALRSSGASLDVVANGGYRDVDNTLDEIRAGGGITSTGDLAGSVVTATVDGDQRWLDGNALAWNVGLTVNVALPIDDQVALPELEARTWHVAEHPDSDGVLVAARYRHWLPIADGDPRRQAELGIGLARYQADSDAETYGEIRVDAGLHGRIGPNRGTGRWDFTAGAWYGLRAYQDGPRERRELAGVAGSCDRWFDRSVALGVEVAWEHTADQPSIDRLDSIHASARATAAF